MSRNAFSLVELSIVLVIIGLLVGGVMVGSSMIRGAEVKSVLAEYAEYKQAGITFRNKYAGLPGDLSDAASYWAAATNGNGDGLIANSGAGAGLTAEYAQFWSQLALAGLVEGQFSGLAGPVGTGGHMVPGTNIPKSTLTNAGWGAWFLGEYAGNGGGTFAQSYGNVLTLGGDPNAGGWNNAAKLTTEEAWNIDTKIDDGMPAVGKWVAFNFADCTTSGVNPNDAAGTYKLDNRAANRCGLYVRHAFND